MIFSDDQLHIILKRRNLEICEHWSIFIIDEIFRNLKIIKLSQLIKPIEQLIELAMSN